ncbi:hypothetical protein IFR04_006144 [Cadophora malorum]|uniref:Methyltransferase n=1 Tax=Cadophora malorum TaxID=108018 RepID=A0A8H7TL49_9HELO|nr:hypothetical protein IFR04_006144 [Cadophora malorum]
MAPLPDRSVEGKIYFLTRLLKYVNEKPYTLRYRPDNEDGLPQTNIERTIQPIDFHDLRAPPDLPYESCGFKVVNLDSAMQYEDYEESTKVETIHVREVEACIKAALAAESAEVLDHVIRRRDQNWPVSTGQSYQFQQPASAAHIDHTYGAGCQLIRDAYGEKADIVLSGQWQCINVWHPLQGPLVDWPLALCDASTVDFANDTMAGDVVDRDAIFENTQVHFNPRQKWFYLSNQLPSEMLIFKNADSEEKFGASPGVPHASFDHPQSSSSGIRRESIEFRMLVRW